MHLDWEQTVRRVSLAATLVESLPISDVVDDNISVPFTNMLTTFLLFGRNILTASDVVIVLKSKSISDVCWNIAPPVFRSRGL